MACRNREWGRGFKMLVQEPLFTPHYVAGYFLVFESETG